SRRREYQHRRNGASPRIGARKSDNDKEVVHTRFDPSTRQASPPLRKLEQQLKHRLSSDLRSRPCTQSLN
ncbi:hypothetical protein X777_07819, partial [Ooceraea biroi]